jgi:hypothetical protein
VLAPAPQPVFPATARDAASQAAAMRHWGPGVAYWHPGAPQPQGGRPVVPVGYWMW